MPQARVLILDDEPSLLGTLALILEAHGYQATTCDRVEAGLELVSRRRFDVLLADLSMPGEGRTVIAAMRRAQPRAAIIVVTGFLGRDEVPAEVRAMADAVLFKPTEVPQLLETMTRLVGRW